MCLPTCAFSGNNWCFCTKLVGMAEVEILKSSIYIIHGSKNVKEPPPPRWPLYLDQTWCVVINSQLWGIGRWFVFMWVCVHYKILVFIKTHFDSFIFQLGLISKLTNQNKKVNIIFGTSGHKNKTIYLHLKNQEKDCVNILVKPELLIRWAYPLS